MFSKHNWKIDGFRCSEENKKGLMYSTLTKKVTVIVVQFDKLP